MSQEKQDSSSSKQTEATAGKRELPSVPYLSALDVDLLARMNLELLSELWIARDRIAVLEKILTDSGVIAEGCLENFVPDEGFSQKLEGLRLSMVENVLGAPFKNNLTVADLKERGQRIARLNSVSRK